MVSAQVVPDVHTHARPTRSSWQVSPAGHAPPPQVGNVDPLHEVGATGAHAHAAPEVWQVCPGGQPPPLLHTGGTTVSQGIGGISVVVVVGVTAPQFEPPGISQTTLGSLAQRGSASKSRTRRPAPGRPPVLFTAPLVVGGMQKIDADCEL